MFNGLDPKKVQAMMKQMGIAQDEIPAERVIIEQENGRIIIDNPSIIKINMKGNESFQISGEIHEESVEEEAESEKLEADIATIMDSTNCDRETAALELEKNKGDIAQTIINLNKK